jgi:hypothetical protein
VPCPPQEECVDLGYKIDFEVTALVIAIGDNQELVLSVLAILDSVGLKVSYPKEKPFP